MASKLPVHITPFLCKNEGENIRFCAFTLICLITNTEPKISVFVRSHCSSFVKLIVGYYSVFKNLCFCAFTLFRFCEAHCWILQRFQKRPFLCVHIDQMRLQKRPFLWLSTFDSIFENLRLCGVFVEISVNTFRKTEVFLSVFVQKRSSLNGALVA